MKKITVFFFIFLLTLIFPRTTFSQTKLDQSKGEIKEGRHSSHDSKGTFLFDALYYILEFGIGDYDTEDHLYNDLTKYPFQHDRAGNYVNPENGFGASWRINIENNILVSNEFVYGNNFKIQYHPFKYFYLASAYTQLYEKDISKDTYSRLSLFSLNFCYDRIRAEKFDIGWNAGINYIGNDVNRGGFAFGLNTNVFPLEKFSIHSAVSWSSVNSGPVNQFEATANYHLGKWVCKLGYNRLKIGTPKYHFLSVGCGVSL